MFSVFEGESRGFRFGISNLRERHAPLNLTTARVEECNGEKLATRKLGPTDGVPEILPCLRVKPEPLTSPRGHKGLVTKPNEDAVIVITAATWWLQAHCQQRIRQSPEGEAA